jgi:hypothetical protein
VLCWHGVNRKGCSVRYMQVTRGSRPARLAVAVVAVVAAGGLVAAEASAAEHPDCAIWAVAPVVDYGAVYGVGVRSDCVQSRTITVSLREDRTFWPDRTLASTTKTGVVNANIHVAWSCAGHQGKWVFTEIKTSAGGSAQSTRTSVSYCATPARGV